MVALGIEAGKFLSNHPIKQHDDCHKHLLQANDKSWKAVGQELIAEEEQAAAKAAAKKAKKLRQKANKQRAQETLQAAIHGSSQLDFDADFPTDIAVTPDSSQHPSLHPAETWPAPIFTSLQLDLDAHSSANTADMHTCLQHTSLHYAEAFQAEAFSSAEQLLKPGAMAAFSIIPDSLQKSTPDPVCQVDPAASAGSSAHLLPQNIGLDTPADITDTSHRTDLLPARANAVTAQAKAADTSHRTELLPARANAVTAQAKAVDTSHRTELLPAEATAVTAQVKAADADYSWEATQHPPVELTTRHGPAAVQTELQRLFCCPITQVGL